GKRHPELTDPEPKQLVESVHASLENLLGIRGKPVLEEVYIIKKAIPQYTIGYYEKMKALEDVERKYTGLYITGAFRGGVSVEDCVTNGKSIAIKISEQMSELTDASLTEVTNV
ncbi:MAG: hypothetical protein IIC40_07800, partial [Candidatus Marinimicrobia bacterium]|nr:hypothetical protein [Candidatus Neomarinimicrobiota bacterium]